MDNDGLDRMATLLELLSDWYWEQDEEYRFTRIEGAVRLAERLKRVREAALGRRRWEAPGLAPVDGDWEPHRAAVLARQSYRDLLLRSTIENGEARYLSVSGEPRFDEAGSFVGYRGITRDVTARVVAEQALRESETRFRSLTELSSDWYWEQDRELRLSFHSSGFAQRSGTTSNKLLGKRRWEEPNRFPLSGTWDEHRAMLEAHEPFRDFEYVRIVDNGEQFFVSLSGVPIFDAAGNFNGYRGIGTNITERKRAEQALRESEALNRAVINSLHEGVFVRDRDETIVACNASAESIYGLSAGQILGRKTLLGLVQYLREDGTPVDAHRQRPGIESLRSGTSERDFVVGVVRPDGKTVWISANADAVLMPGEKKVRGVVISFRDITAQREAGIALRRSQAANRMLAQALQQSTDAIWTKNLEGIVTSWNAGCERLYGFSAEEAVGKPLRELHMRYLPEREYSAILARIRSGRPSQGESVRVAKDGRKIVISLVTAPLFDERGELVGEVSNSRDITELRSMQAEVEALNRELERRVAERTAELETANRELEAFAYSVSHDLRAPLRSIDGFSSLLIERGAATLDEDGKGFLLRIRAAAQRMAVLIDDLLDLSRVSRSEIHRREVNLSELAGAILADFAAEASSRTVKVHIGPALKVHADPGLMRVLLENLFGNAWKFTGNRADARIEFGRAMHDGQEVFFVRDNGAGFDMAYSKRLFGAFQRLHPQTEFEGTGIGLATAQRIVHRHGGRIWADGGIDRGATFFFVI